MTVKPFGDEVLPIEDLKRRADVIVNSVEKIASESQFVRVEIEVEKIDPLKWIYNQSDPVKFYLKEREKDGTERAGYGETVCFFEENGSNREGLLREITGYLNGIPENVKFYGGFSFFNRVKDKHWKSFGSMRFFIPEFELISNKERSIFGLNIVSNDFDKEKLRNSISEIVTVKGDIAENILIEKENSLIPEFEKWEEKINGYLREIESGNLRKIVASRCIKRSYENRINPFFIMKKLQKDSEKRSLFLFVFNGETFFLGATPEILLKRDGNILKTEAIAGTRKHSKNSVISDKMEKELFGSNKELREHDTVTEYIVKKLADICESISISEKKSLKLSTLQHIYTKIECVLKKGAGDGDVVFSIMPTPAVSGDPMGKSMKILEDTEQYDRGWYSGAVGNLGKNSSLLSVSIRSALISGRDIYIYAGAGIVEGSNPEKEWEETELKLEKFKRIMRNESG